MNAKSIDYKQTRKYRQRWLTLVVITVTVIVIGLDQMILNIALPTLQRELQATASELIWMVDAYILVFAGLLLPAGSISDKYGRAKTLQVGVAIFALSSLAAALSQNTGQLIASRAVMGASAALIMTATLSIVTDVFPLEERGRAIGIWAGMSAMGIFLGPVIGGVLLENYSWGSVFLINIPVAVIALVLGFFFIPDSRDPTASRLDIPGFVLSMGSIGLMVYGIIEAPTRGWSDPVVIITLALSIPFVVAFILWERYTSQPMVDLSFFKNPRFSSGAAGTSLASFARLGAAFGLTQYLQFVQGYSPLQAGMRMLPLVLGIAIGASLSDRLVSRLGTNRVVAGGLLFLAAGLLAFNLWQPDTEYWIVAINMFLLAFAVGNIVAPSTDAIMGAVPETKAGVGSAINGATRTVAGALGAAVIGSAMYTIYSDKIAGAVAGLPAELAAAAEDSVGAAVQIAASLPAEAGDALASAAGAAFTDSFGLAMIIGSAAVVIGAILVAVYMPPGHLVVAESEVDEQGDPLGEPAAASATD